MVTGSSLIKAPFAGLTEQGSYADLEMLNKLFREKMKRKEKQEQKRNKPMYASNVDRAEACYDTMVRDFPSRAYRAVRLESRVTIMEEGYHCRPEFMKVEYSSASSEHASAEKMPPPATVPDHGRTQGTPVHSSDEESEKGNKGTASAASDKGWSVEDLTEEMEAYEQGLAESTRVKKETLRQLFQKHMKQLEDNFIDPRDVDFGHDFMVDEKERIVIKEYKYPKKSANLDTDNRVEHLYESSSKFTHWYITSHCPVLISLSLV